MEVQCLFHPVNTQRRQYFLFRPNQLLHEANTKNSNPNNHITLSSMHTAFLCGEKNRGREPRTPSSTKHTWPRKWAFPKITLSAPSSCMLDADEMFQKKPLLSSPDTIYGGFLSSKHKPCVWNMGMWNALWNTKREKDLFLVCLCCAII